MHCHYFDVGDCHSCTLMGTPYAEQLARKDERVRDRLARHITPEAWLPPATSSPERFRNKAKLAVGGTAQAPTLGLTNAAGHGVDLRECGIHERAIWQIIPDLAGFITLTGLRPYDVAAREGDLKFVIVTAAPDGHLMLRFVLTDETHVPIVRQHLPALLRRLPQVRVVSANIHPEHKAVLEGAVDIPLTNAQDLPLHLDHVTLHLRQRSFFQTNTPVAEQLYAQAGRWADDAAPRRILDLYCGVGGFALHLAAPARSVHGMEIEPDAIASARRSAKESGVGAVTFEVGDATTSVGLIDGTAAPDLVVVNPPRRGIGSDLAAALDGSEVTSVIYSSCNPTTLATDLGAMPSFAVEQARLFDMFPQTDHAEVAVLLRRR